MARTLRPLEALADDLVVVVHTGTLPQKSVGAPITMLVAGVSLVARGVEIHVRMTSLRTYLQEVDLKP
jgi:hypothetical protein